MNKKIFRFFLAFIGLIFLVYLILPPPQKVPDLPGGFKSSLPDDVYNIPGLSVYYTDLERQEVIRFYKESYSRSSFFNIPLFTYLINHPVEYARETIKETLQSSYYEEIVHPLRESLYVNGYEWQNDPFYRPEQREQFKLIIDGKLYKSKVTIIARESNPLSRVIVYIGIIIFILWIFKEIKGIVQDLKK